MWLVIEESSHLRFNPCIQADTLLDYHSPYFHEWLELFFSVSPSTLSSSSPVSTTHEPQFSSRRTVAGRQLDPILVFVRSVHNPLLLLSSPLLCSLKQRVLDKTPSEESPNPTVFSQSLNITSIHPQSRDALTNGTFSVHPAGANRIQIVYKWASLFTRAQEGEREDDDEEVIALVHSCVHHSWRCHGILNPIRVR